MSWTTEETPLAGAFEQRPFNYWEIAPDRPALSGAGGWVVATRRVPDAPDPFFAVQAVAISSDMGITWETVDLPAPDGMVGVVHAAAEIDGELLLAGAVQKPPAPGEPPLGGQEQFDQRRAAYDARYGVAPQMPRSRAKQLRGSTANHTHRHSGPWRSSVTGDSL